MIDRTLLNLAAFAFIAVLLPASMASAFFFQDGPDEVEGVFQNYTYRKGDTIVSLAQRFDVGVQALLDANNAKGRPKRFKPGDMLVIPSAHVLPSVRANGIVINLAELRLYFFREGEQPVSYPVSIGKEGWETPIGETSVVRKRKNPVWVPTPALLAEDPDLPRSVPPGPNNPLGAFALNLGWAGFAIHGTNAPDSIGKRVSHGCIRMYPDDIEALFERVEAGTHVTVINEPFKLGWQGKTLYLEISPPYRKGQKEVLLDDIDIYLAIIKKAGKSKVLWDNVTNAIEAMNGVPTAIAIGKQAPQTDKPLRIGMLLEKQ